MNEPTIEQVGDFPKYDKDLGIVGRQFSYGIKKQVLLGNFDAEPGADEEMLKAFREEYTTKKSRKKASNVVAFLETWGK
jgi:hypothetical protein